MNLYLANAYIFEAFKFANVCIKLLRDKFKNELLHVCNNHVSNNFFRKSEKNISSLRFVIDLNSNLNHDMQKIIS